MRGSPRALAGACSLRRELRPVVRTIPLGSFSLRARAFARAAPPPDLKMKEVRLRNQNRATSLPSRSRPEVRGVRDGQACHSLPVHRSLRLHPYSDAARHGNRGRAHLLPLLRYRSCLELRRGALRGAAQAAGSARELQFAESDSSARATPLRAGFARVSAGNPAPIFRRSGLRRWRPFPE